MRQYQEFEINYYQDEDGVFTAQVPAIRGCVASGKTLDEAYRHAIEAIESCLEARAKVAALKFQKKIISRERTQGTQNGSILCALCVLLRPLCLPQELIDPLYVTS